MKPENTHELLISGFALLIVLACSVSYTAEFPTATGPVPTETAMIVPPTMSPGAPPANPPPFVISTGNINEVDPNSEYTINAQYPTILENNDPRALAFNTEMNILVQSEIGAFKKLVSEAPRDATFTASSFEVKYGILFQNERISSIKFESSGYISGAAHPYGYSRTVNYDFDQGRDLSLDELFLPGSNHLEVISKYCLAELSRRGFDVFTDGAAPTPENYRHWNITTNGLLISFDAYQVAAGAAGPQTVVVPYGELQAVIDPQGPLAAFTR